VGWVVHFDERKVDLSVKIKLEEDDPQNPHPIKACVMSRPFSVEITR